MNSWINLFLIVGLACNLASSQSSLETSHGTLNQPDLNCAFEAGLCGWIYATTTQMLKWKTHRRGVSNYYHRTGPLSDHTTGDGYFLSMRISYSYEAGSVVLISPPVVTKNDTCLSFWYFMYGNSVGSLNVYKAGHGGVKDQLFTISGPQGNRWYRAVVNSGDGLFKLHIEATFGGENRYGEIAIDDITFSYQACKEDDSTLFKDQPRFDCDFEHDFCSWYFQDDDTLTWCIRTEPSDTNNRNAHPPRSNGTSYVEMMRKSSRGYQDETALKGPSISVNSDKACLSFWYRMNGSAVKWFKVKMYDFGKSPFYEGRTVFTNRYESGVVWIQGLVTLPEGNNYHIAFYVSTPRYEEGSFDLDDIRLTHGGPCKEDEARLVNCDFERDFCRWYMKSKKDEGDWLRIRGPTPTNSTGPLQDHTTGDGHFIFLDASNVEEANLYSSPFAVNYSGACLSFWYYMHGADVQILQLRTLSERYYYTFIDWSRRGPQGDHWIQQNISLLHSDYDTRLVFTARRSYFPRGDIALDDISITFGAPCESDVKKETTVPTFVFPEVSSDDPITADTSQTTMTTTTEAPPLETPQLMVKGKINPAFNNSRIELICQHAEENVRIRWHRDFGHDGRSTLGQWGQRLVFEEIHPSNAGMYYCNLERHYGFTSNASNVVKIKVVPDPRPSPRLAITSEGYNSAFHFGNPIDLLVDFGVKLVCGDEIIGGEYHWRTTSNAFNSLNLPKDRFLVLNGTQPKHSGVYSCRISKDTYMTAKSNELNLSVRPGKWCIYDWSCDGDNYYESCEQNRCECHRDAVIHGRGCRKGPKKPKITTSPQFLEFGLRESFYLVCEADDPAPADLTYTFTKQYDYLSKESHSIMKITNATERDSGYYKCHVTSDGIESKESESIYIQIQDFIDLNCDFTKDSCAWSQKNDSYTTTFTFMRSDNDGDGQNGEPSNPFIQLDASNTKVPNRAILVSPTIERMALDSCLSFRYRMHGPDVYSLSVWRYLYSRKSEQFEGSKLWSAIGDKGDTWFKQTATVGNGTKFYIAFDAIGQAAIDDITFTYRGSC